MVKLEKPKKRGSAASWGRRGLLGRAPRCSPGVSPRLGEFPGRRARGLQRAERGARGRREGAAGRMVPGRGTDARRSPARSPASPAPGPRVGGARSAPSTRRALPAPWEAGARAELWPPSRAERRSCPNSRSRSARPLGAAAAAPAAGCGAELQAAPRAPGRRHLRPDPGGSRWAGRGGGGRGGAEAPERGPEATPPAAHLLPAPREMHRTVCRKKRKTQKLLALWRPPGKLADWFSGAELGAPGNFGGAAFVSGSAVRRGSPRAGSLRLTWARAPPKLKRAAAALPGAVTGLVILIDPPLTPQAGRGVFCDYSYLKHHQGTFKNVFLGKEEKRWRQKFRKGNWN